MDEEVTEFAECERGSKIILLGARWDALLTFVSLRLLLLVGMW